MIWIVSAIYFLIIVFALFFDVRHRFETREQLCERLGKYSHATDKDFVAKMPADISPEVALGVRRIIVDVGGVEVDEVWPETRLLDLLE